MRATPRCMGAPGTAPGSPPPTPPSNCSRGTLKKNTLPWRAEGIAGELVWSDGASVKIAVNSLKNRRQPPAVQPLRLTGEAALAGTHLDFTLHAETEAAGAKGKLTMEIKGRHDRASDTGSASVAMSPAVFRAPGLQPVDFFPVLEDALSEVSGTVAVSGSVRWHRLAVSPHIRS